MPTYEYKCESGHSFEEFHSINDHPRVLCPVCGASASRQIGSGSGLMFKGSGFYITDYKKPKDSTDSPGKGDKKKDK